jgi:glycosyltransferase involved in cell wall biosynthesis
LLEVRFMPVQVSICIPTYKRPELLKLAIDSCLAQSCQNFRILVSDDSPDNRTREWIDAHPARGRIDYMHNTPALRQAKNVNQLFQSCKTEFLLLLHDDDILMPNALEDLMRPLLADPEVVAAFGKQYLITHEGQVLESESEALNLRFYKTEERGNCRQQPLWSAITQQFPNDTYLVRTRAAQQVGYRDAPEVGEACDADFGFRLAALGRPFYFVNKYTAAYRQTEHSVSSSGLRVLLAKLYFLVRKTGVPTEVEPFRRKRLRELAPVAVSGCLLSGARSQALSILLGPDYVWRRQPLKACFQLALIAAPTAWSRKLIERR